MPPKNQFEHQGDPSKVEDSFLSQGAVAEMLDISERTLERWRLEGTGPPFFRFGRCCRYKRSLTLSWADSKLSTSTSDRCGGSS